MAYPIKQYSTGGEITNYSLERILDSVRTGTMYPIDRATFTSTNLCSTPYNFSAFSDFISFYKGIWGFYETDDTKQKTNEFQIEE